MVNLKAKKILLFLVCMLLLWGGKAFSQSNFTLKGKVTGADARALSNVSISVKGSNRGTSSSAAGEFTIDAKRGDVLVLSYVGYGTREFTVTESKFVEITLTATGGSMNEVVVTALGIRRERKSLGYSVTEVKGEELTQAREVNVASSLEGKVAGLNVSTVSGGAGASSNVIIRGLSSLSPNTQPLYVVNGVPMESQPGATGSGQYQNASDLGDAVGNLNPDDIETISVLKGAAASALYGYRAKAGVILITTKTGRGGGIELNSNYVGEQVFDLTNFQYVYGQGSNNLKPASQADAFQTGGSSWGAKLDGSNVVQFDGVSRPYIAQKNNIKNFYQTGGTFTNTISFNQGFTGGNIRLSASNLNDKSPIPNATLTRQTFNLAATFNPIKNLVIDARANYILEHATNRPILGDLSGNANYNVMFLPTSVDVAILKKRVNDNGSEYAYTANTFATNPWFAAYSFVNATSRNRLLSSISARYNFENGLFAQFRAGNDAYTTRVTRVTPSGTAYRPAGDISEQSSKFNDINVDGLVGKTFKAGSDFTITPNLGASLRKTNSETITNSGSDFAVFGVYNLGNAKNKSASYGISNQETQSVYGTLELTYKSLIYITGSGRSDWFSTLATPGKDNKLNIFYPSISTSFVFSDLLSTTSWLNFGKLRAGYAVVGQATSPYQTQLTYGFMGYTLNGRPLGQISGSSIPNAGLRPSKASEFEIGTEMRLFNNKVSLDITWYSKKSTDEILSAPTSATSGYSGAVLNIGQLKNEGVEALISFTPVKTANFSWTTSVNGALNNNKVIALAAGQAQLQFGIARSGVGFTSNIVGLPSIQVMAFDYKYDATGKIMLGATGIPLQGSLIPMGPAFGKWSGGWSNDLNYKRINLSFLIDGKFGGKVFSGTDYTAYTSGLHQATLENREGVFGNNLNAQTYYSTLASNVSKMFVQDASFIKFRQLALGYSFSSKLFHNVIKGMNLSLVGRNLFILMKKTTNIDPEASYSVGAQGLEAGGVPPSRTYGINLNVKL